MGGGGDAGSSGSGAAGAAGGASVCEGVWTAVPGVGDARGFAYANGTLHAITFNGTSPHVAHIAPGETAWTDVTTSPPLYDDKPINNVSPAFEPWSLSVVSDKLVHVYAVRYGQSRTYRAAVIDPSTGAATKVAEQVGVNDFPAVTANATKVVAFGGLYGGLVQNGSCYGNALTAVVDPLAASTKGGSSSPLLGRERAHAGRAGEQLHFFGGQERLVSSGCASANPIIDHFDDGAFFDPATNLWGPRLEVLDEETTAVVSLGGRAAVLTAVSICTVAPGEPSLTCFKPGPDGYGVLGGHDTPIVHFGTSRGIVSANLVFQSAHVSDPTAKKVSPICPLPTKLESKNEPSPSDRFAAGAGDRGVVWGANGGFFFAF